MSDDAKPKKKKKGGGMKMILLIVIAMVIGGAGAAGGLYVAGFFSPTGEGPKKDPDKPVLGDRTSVVWGKGGSVRVELGGTRFLNKNIKTREPYNIHGSFSYDSNDNR